MSDYLDALVARNSAARPTLQPRLASLFEPPPGTWAFSQHTPDLQTEEYESASGSAASGSAASGSGELQPASSLATPDRAVAGSIGSRDLSPIEPKTLPVSSTPPTPPAGDSGALHKQRLFGSDISHDENSSVAANSEAFLPASPAGENVFSAPAFSVQPHVMPLNDAAASALKPSAVEPAPVVRVTIGRIEVRAQFPAPPRVQPAAPRGPKRSLEDYLKQRNGEQR